MTVEQKRKILKRIKAIEKDISALEEVKMTLAKSEFASATMSSGSGSRSYTRADIGKVTAAIASMKIELKNMRRLLVGQSQTMPKQIYTIYS